MRQIAETLLDRLVAGEPVHEPVVLIAAHPDDEIIGAGTRLHLLQELTLVHVTDGAPRNMHDAHAYGFVSAAEYSAARHSELESALAIAGCRPKRTVEIGIPDQQTSLQMAELAERLRALIAEVAPAAILTHPYEGGHPDHDATAFAVHAAASRGFPGVIVEFTSYHRENCRFVAEEFLGKNRVHTAVLGSAERRHKRLMLDCFYTQRETLAQFACEAERFRIAPAYDFTTPPHEGKLHYEHYDWGMTGVRFRELARDALARLSAQDAAA